MNDRLVPTTIVCVQVIGQPEGEDEEGQNEAYH